MTVIPVTKAPVAPILSGLAELGPRSLWDVRHLSPAGTARWHRFVAHEARHCRRVLRVPPNFYRPRDVVWEQLRAPNIWHDEGEQWMVNVCFTEDVGLPVPANFYLGLDNRGSLAEADVLTDLVSEPSTNGYARQAIASDTTDWTDTQDSGDWQVASTTETFNASGGSWGPVQAMFLCDVSTGTAGDLYCSLALSASRTLQDGDSLQADITIKISE